ncbi:hypothetical protein F4Y93_10875 [Candidatus Poribacteria bacterium]|nr:hypothetical protein [Candidatus Poribacteria bacterium]
MGLIKFIKQVTGVAAGVATGNTALIARNTRRIAEGALSKRGPKTVPSSAPTLAGAAQMPPPIPIPPSAQNGATPALAGTVQVPTPIGSVDTGIDLNPFIKGRQGLGNLFSRNGKDKGNLGEILAALESGKKTSKRGMFKFLLKSGALEGIAVEPLQFVGPNGSIRRGSYNGYVIVNYMENGARMSVQMPRFLAEAMGVWKRKRKPVISVRDSNAIRRSNTAKRRLKTAAKNSGLYVADKRPTSRKC